MHLSFKLVQSPFALKSGQPCNGSTLFAGEFGTARVVLDAGARPCSSGGSRHTEFVGDLRVRHLALQGGDPATAKHIGTAGHGRAVAPQQHRVRKARDDLRVRHLALQSGDPAPAPPIITARHGRTVAPQQHRVQTARGRHPHTAARAPGRRGRTLGSAVPRTLGRIIREL